MAIQYPAKLKGDEPAWLLLAKAELGTAEIFGARDNPRIMAYYRDAGHPEIDHDEVPWCAAFVGAILERSGNPSSKQLNARSYLTWGKEVDGPEVGAVCVITRGNPRSWEGHVFFVVDWTDDQVLALGGNQSDRVCLAWYPRERVLGYRVPVTDSSSRTITAAKIATGATSVGGLAKAIEVIAASKPEVVEASSALKEAASWMPALTFVAALLTVLAIACVIYARKDDLATKGR